MGVRAQGLVGMKMFASNTYGSMILQTYGNKILFGGEGKAATAHKGGQCTGGTDPNLVGDTKWEGCCHAVRLANGFLFMYTSLSASYHISKGGYPSRTGQY